MSFIWDAPWIDWAQYNSSIQQPMVRNAGEALGVRAEADKFWLGSREFDPANVGLEYGEIEGGFELDTGLPGNSNEGHEFNDERTRPGRIGPALPGNEIDALLEYLKSI